MNNCPTKIIYYSADCIRQLKIALFCFINNYFCWHWVRAGELPPLFCTQITFTDFFVPNILIKKIYKEANYLTVNNYQIT